MHIFLVLAERVSEKNQIIFIPDQSIKINEICWTESPFGELDLAVLTRAPFPEKGAIDMDP